MNPTQYGAWRPQKYYATKSPLSKGIKLFLSVGMLIKRFGVNEKTLRNGISRFMKGLSLWYRAFRDGEALMVDHETLPANVRAKAKLPADPNAAYDLLRAEYEMQNDINRDAEFKNLKEVLEDLYHNRWPPFLKFYTARIKDEQEQILTAKSHAIIDGVIKAHNERWPSKLIYEAYSLVIRGEIDALKEPVFFTVSPVYFWRKISECRRYGIPQTLVHDLRGVARGAKVMTGQIIAFARLELRKPTRPTIAKVIESIRKKFGVEVSDSSVKKIKTKNLDRQVIQYDSNGKENSRQNGLPKITRFLAEGPGEQFQGDFYKLQMYCRHHTGAVVRLWAYMVLDVFSKKITGWALAEKPLASQAKNAFKMAFVENCFLPEEIIVDNDVVYKRKIFKRLMRRLNNLGVITTKAYPHLPTWKAEIESAFAVFQKLHSDKPWFIGEDIKSKNFAGNPAIEVRKKLYKDKKNMLTENEMHTEFGKLVQDYNQMTNNRKKKASPSETFRMYKSRRTIKLEDHMVPLLFWKAKTKKRIKDDGRIDLQIDGVEYRYQVTEAEMLWKHKNTDVRMCYDPSDMSKVFIYERGTLNFIGAIEPRMVMTRGNKAEVIKKQRRILREAQQYLKDARQRDEDIVNGKTQDRWPISRASLEDKLIRRCMCREKAEAEVAGVPVHP